MKFLFSILIVAAAFFVLPVVFDCSSKAADNLIQLTSNKDKDDKDAAPSAKTVAGDNSQNSHLALRKN